MDPKVFITTFAAVFIAELADKTQLVGINMSASSGKPLTVWTASVAAYMGITAVSVLLGGFLAERIDPALTGYFAGSLFIIIGILMITGKI
jgi:putative Ca2+/H+ antiporter (TMEM165/GDT1 family)